MTKPGEGRDGAEGGKLAGPAARPSPGFAERSAPGVGLTVSVLAHAALAAVALFGGQLFRPDPNAGIAVANVVLLTESEYGAQFSRPPPLADLEAEASAALSEPVQPDEAPEEPPDGRDSRESPPRPAAPQAVALSEPSAPPEPEPPSAASPLGDISALPRHVRRADRLASAPEQEADPARPRLPDAAAPPEAAPALSVAAQPPGGEGSVLEPAAASARSAPDPSSLGPETPARPRLPDAAAPPEAASALSVAAQPPGGEGSVPGPAAASARSAPDPSSLGPGTPAPPAVADETDAVLPPDIPAPALATVLDLPDIVPSAGQPEVADGEGPGAAILVESGVALPAVPEQPFAEPASLASDTRRSEPITAAALELPNDVSPPDDPEFANDERQQIAALPGTVAARPPAPGLPFADPVSEPPPLPTELDVDLSLPREADRPNVDIALPVPLIEEIRLAPPPRRNLPVAAEDPEAGDEAPEFAAKPPPSRPSASDLGGEDGFGATLASLQASVAALPEAGSSDRRPFRFTGSLLTESELNALHDKLAKCWRPITIIGQVAPEELAITLQVDLTLDGAVVDQQLVAPSPLPPQRAYGVAFSVAQAAIIRCAPYDEFPKEKYPHWRRIVVTFDPRLMAR